MFPPRLTSAARKMAWMRSLLIRRLLQSPHCFSFVPVPMNPLANSFPLPKIIRLSIYKFPLADESKDAGTRAYRGLNKVLRSEFPYATAEFRISALRLSTTLTNGEKLAPNTKNSPPC